MHHVEHHERVVRGAEAVLKHDGSADARALVSEQIDRTLAKWANTESAQASAWMSAPGDGET
jgi:2-polyprenyl-3-methyl-5-hydroxy-6-metoxy-1,4-benzoquinol methylase